MLPIQNLLVARDFSSVSDRALRYAFNLAARTGAVLHVFHAEVLHETDTASDRSMTDDLDALREELKETGALAPEAVNSVRVTEATRRDVSPAPAILNYAAEADVDLIALGTHGRSGPRRILLGSVAEEVVRKAGRPVLTVRKGEDVASGPVPQTLDRLLVPIDFSDPAREALQAAKEWAALYDARIDALHVIPEKLSPAFYVGGISSIYDMHPDIEEKVEARLRSFLADTDGPSVDLRPQVVVGNAVPDIITFAEDNETDLVMMSTHGRTGLDRFLLGSVVEKVVRHVPCPIVTMNASGRSVQPSDSSAAPPSAE